jgi:hypothetical protein
MHSRQRTTASDLLLDFGAFRFLQRWDFVAMEMGVSGNCMSNNISKLGEKRKIDIARRNWYRWHQYPTKALTTRDLIESVICGRSAYCLVDC